MVANSTDLLTTLAAKLNFDFSGTLDSKLTQWTESTIYETFERMITIDDRITGAFQIRQASALSYPWQVLPVSEDARDVERAALVSAVLENFDIMNALKDIWNAIPFGLSVCEIEWGNINGQIVPVKLIGISNRMLEIKADGVVIKQSGAPDINTWEHPMKFVVFSYSPLFNNPQGRPVLAACYWPYIFKKLGMRFWATVLEKFGIPSLVALFDSNFPSTLPDGAEGDTIETLGTAIVTALANLKSGGNAAVANIKDVKILQPEGSGDDFEKFLNACNNMISIAVLGNTMTMDAQSRGSQALGTVHERISEQVARGDVGALAKVVNSTLMRWLTDLLFGADVPAPIFSFDTDGETSWDNVKDAMDRGVPVSLKAIYSKIRGYQPADETDAFVVTTSTPDTAGVGMSARPFVSPSLPGRKKRT